MIVFEVLRWLVEPANWAGRQGIPTRLVEHAQVTVPAILAAAALAVPTGVVTGHARRGGTIAAAIANLGRAVPTLGLLVIALLITLALGLRMEYWPTFVALFLVGLHPMFTNAYTAVRDADPAAVEAARGMGLRERDVLLHVELPLASPVILAAVRVAAVQIVATAPIGALVAGGGLGRYVIDGFYQRDFAEMLGGIALIAVVALVTERLFDLLERAAVPTGIQRTSAGSVAQTARAV
ncbi:MAG: ABC transporter permease subunit [Actinobacteria bacterium]|nr:ABC transporter permease subunit [Actinomycetota bacterium]